MITAKRLEEFWNYPQDASAREIMANATVINNGLFLDAFELDGLGTGTQLEGWSLYTHKGTSWPETLPDSFLHHRVLLYRLGPLNIVVVGNVEAVVDDRIAQVHLFENVYPKVPILGWRGLYQTWFRRYLAVFAVRKEHVTIVEESVSNVKRYWRRWERFENIQTPLRSLVTLLEQLRDVLQRKAPGEPFVVEKRSKSQRHPGHQRTDNDETPAEHSHVSEEEPRYKRRHTYLLEV